VGRGTPLENVVISSRTGRHLDIPLPFPSQTAAETTKHLALNRSSPCRIHMQQTHCLPRATLSGMIRKPKTYPEWLTRRW